MSTLKDYPEISFIESITLENVQTSLINDFLDKYKEITEEDISLGNADPSRLILNACSIQIYQALQYIDRAGKQSFLKYAYGDFLENLGALKGIKRIQGTAAQTKVRFMLAEKQTFAITIPKGTKIATEGDVYFYTLEQGEVSSGKINTDIIAECNKKGVVGNGYIEGKINNMVDLLPYVANVENIEISAGGTEIEKDKSFAERIFLAPSSYSVAGPKDAYVYWVKTFNPNINDVKVLSPSPGIVDIRIVEGGNIPDESVIRKMQEDIQNSNIRPLTDKVEVSAPEQVDYKIIFEYWINESDKNTALTIKDKVKAAVLQFIKWQKEKIGKDINPSHLQYLIINAGVKRTNIQEPIYTLMEETSIANFTEESVIYRGIEND